MVELSWYRVEVEMERGRKKKQGWVGMRGGDRAGSASDSAGFWPALRRCVGLRRYHPPPENKANDVVIWGGGVRGWATVEKANGECTPQERRQTAVEALPEAQASQQVS